MEITRRPLRPQESKRLLPEIRGAPGWGTAAMAGACPHYTPQPAPPERGDQRVPVVDGLVVRSLLPMVLLAGLLSACATVPACTERGGPRWTEWATPHFRVLSDLDDEEAEETADAFEELRSALIGVAWRGLPDPTRPLVAVVFRNGREMNAFTPAHVDGVFVPEGLSDGMIITYASGSLSDRETLRHEIVHSLAARFGLGHRAPRWLQEGLAEYLAKVGRDPDSGRLVFGDADPAWVRLLHLRGGLPFEELWTPPQPANAPQFYATSWLLVHYLMNHHADRLESLQRAIALGRDARHAWDEIVGLKATDVDDALFAYLNHGGFVKYQVRPRTPAFSLSERTLSDAELHGLRALLYAEGPARDGDRQSRARAEVTEALHQDPLELRALGVERFHLGQRRDDTQTAEALVRRHPDEPLAWLVLAEARAARNDRTGATTALAQARRLGYQGRDTPEIVAPARLH